MTQNEIFREIEEDLERQRYEALWKRYGVWLMSGAALVVLATAIYSTIESSRVEKNQRASGELVSILHNDKVEPAKEAEALEAYAAAHPSIVHGTLAQLDAASLEVRAGNKDKAAAIYDAVSKDASADIMFRQFADLRWVQLRFDIEDSALLQARLTPLLAHDAPWHASAAEYMGYLALRTGDKARAKEIFTDLSQDASAPQTLSARAVAMLRYIGE